MHPRTRLVPALTAAATMLCAHNALAQCQTTEAFQLNDPDGDAPFDGFGYAIDISGDTMIVGEPNQNRAHSFRLVNGTWIREDIITQSPDNTVGLGISVAIDGDYAVVSTVENLSDCNDPNDCTTGAAWIYTRNGNTWTQSTKLSRPFYLDEFNQFGYDVDMLGDTVVVSAPGSLEGIVVPWRFDGSQWNRLDPLVASDGELDDAFGRSVAVGNGVIVVGAPNSDDFGDRTGSAYIYRRTSATTWIQDIKLLPNDLMAEDRFGTGVAVRGNLVAVGSGGGGSSFATTIGAVYLYRDTGGTWTQEAKLVPANGQVGDAFGWEVEIVDDNTIIASALTDAVNGNRAGAAYIFTKVGGVWIEQARLDASDASADQLFGISIAGGDGFAAIGAAEFDNGGGGTVYHFGGIGDCNSNQTLDLCDITQGTSSDTNQNQIPDECEADCVATEFAELVNPQNANEYAGSQVAIMGDFAAVGVPNDQSNGRVDIYNWDGSAWNLATSAIGEGLDPGAMLGSSLSMAGDVLVAGAPRHKGSLGAVAVYRNVNGVWNFEATLAQAFPETIQFGSSVATDGNTILVGVRGTGSPATQITYVFEYDTVGHDWIQTDKLTASHGNTGDGFSASLSVEGDMIAVGAPFRDVNSLPSAGAAYVFTKSHGVWQQEALITAPDAFNGDRFGTSLSLHNARLLIGAPQDDDLGNNSGSAYIFTRRANNQTWNFTTKLLPPDGSASDAFGTSVAMTESTAIIGAQQALSTGPGTAYVFTRDTSGAWNHAAKLLAADDQTGDFFGTSVALHNSRAIVGAPFHNHGGPDSGAAYVYHGIGDCNNNARLDRCDIALGASADNNHNGEPDECECPADFNMDGNLNTQDVLAFLNAWVANDNSADFNMDGIVNTQDVLAFLNAWNAGC